MDPKYPNVEVELTGQDGNVFNIIGRVRRELRRKVGPEEAAAFVKEATSQKSYDDVLQCVMRWVEVE